MTLRNTSLLFLLLLHFFSTQSLPVINSINPNKDTLHALTKFEIDLDIIASFSNPYNKDEVNVFCHFIDPTGDTSVSAGFWYQRFNEIQPDSLVPSGQPGWKIRFTPRLAGGWTYFVEVSDTSGTVWSGNRHFLCLSPVTKGFLECDSGNYFRIHTPGMLDCLPVRGFNLAWGQSEGKFGSYYDWINKMDQVHANYIKIMMTPWAFELEDSILGDYSFRQNAAWYLDEILDRAHGRDIYTQVAFLIHDPFRTSSLHWDQNPYNTQNGGPCIDPLDFFSDSIPKEIFKRKLQYIINRWAYHPGLAAWEIISEADNVQDYNSNQALIRQWILEMAAYVKSLDQYNHPVTAGFAVPSNDSLLWKDSLIDFTQTHIYDQLPDLEMRMYAHNLDYLKRFGKPTINGEFSIYDHPDSLIVNDPNGIHLHNAIWATYLSGAMGTSMSWWWNNYIDPMNLYYHFNELSTNNLVFNIYESEIKPERYRIVTDDHFNETVRPAFKKFLQKSPASEFTLEQNGLLTPMADMLGNILYGNGLLVSGFRNPPTFHTDYPVNGYLEITTGANVINSVLTITIDGISAFSATAEPDTTYTVLIGAGKHSITIDNSTSANGVIEISSLVFGNHATSLRALALSARNLDWWAHVCQGWIHHRNYNWKFVRDNGMPDSIHGATMVVPVLGWGFEYQILFFNTLNGDLVAQQSKSAITDTLEFDIPPVATDLCFAIWFIPESVDEIKQAPGSLKIYPNPMLDEVSFTFSLDQYEEVLIRIYEITGKLIAVPFRGKLLPGEHTIAWKGTTPPGISFPPGIYIVTINTGDETITGKLLKQQ